MKIKYIDVEDLGRYHANFLVDHKHWMNDPEVTKYNTHGIYTYFYKDFEDFKQVILNKEIFFWAIIVDDKYIGNVCLQSLDLINRKAEIAILIGDREYWNKGIATEAFMFVIRHGFEKMNLNKLYIGTPENNTGMIKVAKKLGMQKEGQLRSEMYFDFEYQDVVRYSMLKGEYKSVRFLKAIKDMEFIEK